MTIEAQHGDHDNIERLIKRVLVALGPPYDGAAELGNVAFARRLVAALIALRVLHIASAEPQPGDEQDQRKKEEGHSRNKGAVSTRT